MRKWFIILLAIVIVMSLATYTGVTRSFFIDQEDSSDDALCTITDWYHLAWHWRKPLTISNSGGALTDYQVKVTINTQELISAGKMQPDGDDIRFTSSDGTTEIPYWIESGVNTTATIIWVRVSSIPNGDSTIYIYYQNDSASAATSVSATFDSGSFQDLFDDISELDTADSSGVAVTAGEAQLIVADTEVNDMNQVLATSGVEMYDQQWVGQTFYANLDGFLTKVTIRVNKQGSPPNALEVQIRNSSGNEPGSTVYATASRDDIATLGNYDFSFNVATTVTAGTRYAVVTKTIGGDASNYYYARYNPDVYPGGRAVLSTNSGSSWIGYDAFDYYCKTYITCAAEIDQSQIASSADWPVYGTNWSSQSFVAAESGDLAMVVINAAASGSPPNALTVEVQDAEESILEVVDQSQTAYTTDRQAYNNNWWAQTFRTGSSGDLSKITLRAALIESGSPPGDLTVELRNVTTGYQESEDQSQTAYTGDRQVYSDNWRAQVFQAGISGSLSKITLRAALIESGSPPNALTAELRNVTGASEENVDQSQTSYSASVATYDNQWIGQTFQAGASGNLTKVILGLARTENEDQSQTAYTGDRQVYSDNWVAQVFQAGISGSLSKITLRAAATGSPPNALTVELRDLISSYQDTEDQSQTSYTADRQVYNVNWVAQVFQAGMSGDLNKITLRAAATGSPPNDLTVELRDATSGYQENEDQSQTAYTGDRQVYGNNWVAQIFQAGTSGTLSKATLRAALIESGSPPGDLTMELRNAIQDEILDQSQTSYSPGYDLYDNRWVAQTFQAGASGTLTKITLTVNKNGSPANPLEVQVRDCTGGDLPGTNIYATASLNPGDITSAGQYDFIFGTPASVTSGTKYAIVIKTDGGDVSNNYPLYYQGSDVYANGQACLSTNSGTDWTGYAFDSYFQTYITVSARIPGSTVYATATRSDVTTAGEYDFTYASPYSVTSGTKYALVIYTSAGDASNYYNVSYQDSDAYSDGRECSSTNSGTDWSGSDTTDLYFRTYVPVASGYIPGSTIYATASRSDVTTAGEYDFTYASPYSVTSGTQYALVIYTSAGDASTYYNVSYQDSDAYGNGRECSSANGGTDWTGSNATDLYFQTKVGVALEAVDIQIRNCTVEDLPGTTVYASTSKEPEEIDTSFGTYDFTFTTPASLIAGVKYAIVIKTDSGDANNNYPFYYETSDVYSNGQACLSTDSSGSWDGYALDVYFQTYVTASAYTPGSTVYATASRSDVTTAGEYDFTYASPYSVTVGTKYALVIYTSAGDASNYYNVSYQNSDVYSNGRECSSANSGTDWTGSDTTDLYFRTYVTLQVGDTPGSTVYATASRSDITTAGEYDFVFASPYSVTAETNYALVIYTSGGDAVNYYNVSYQGSNAYGLGKECASSDSGGSWLPNSSADLYFKTYISSSTGKYQPGGTVYASASRSDIGTSAQGQVFFFATPAAISSGTRYTIVVKTSGGDAANYYNISYQNVNAYANGDRGYSADGGTIWTMTDYDLWFKTYVEFDQAVSASAIVRSAAIPTASDARFAVGVQLPWNDTEQTNSDIKYQLEYYTGSAWSLIPDSDLAGNSTGFDGSPLDISSMLTYYDQIRLVANLSSTYNTDIPSVQDWTVTYYYRQYTAPEPEMSGIGDEE